MKIESVFDPSFSRFGKVLEGYDTKCLLEAMWAIPMPEAGTAYEPSIPALEATCVYGPLQNNAYGGVPIQLGMCWGYNTKLNCLEYHRDSELNCGATDYVCLLAKLEDMEDGMLDTSKVHAFRVPAGVVVNVYATTLHYAPCSAAPGAGFKVMIGLPRGTNGPKPAIAPLNEEDKALFGRNKWLLAHPEADEAAQGAVVGLKGVNIDIAADL